MTMLLPLFILVGFIAGYFVNAIAYHLSPLEDKTALTFRQVLVHFRQKKYAWHDTAKKKSRICFSGVYAISEYERA